MHPLKIYLNLSIPRVFAHSLIYIIVIETGPAIEQSSPRFDGSLV